MGAGVNYPALKDRACSPVSMGLVDQTQTPLKGGDYVGRT